MCMHDCMRVCVLERDCRRSEVAHLSKIQAQRACVLDQGVASLFGDHDDLTLAATVTTSGIGLMILNGE